MSKVSGKVEGMKCRKCKRKLRVGVHCESCDSWFHTKCCEVSIDENETNDWMCKHCMDFRVRKLLEEKEKVIEQLREKLRMAEKKIAELKNENALLKADNSGDSSKEGWSSVANKQRTHVKDGMYRVIGDSMLRFAGEECVKNGIKVDVHLGIRIEQVE